MLKIMYSIKQLIPCPIFCPITDFSVLCKPKRFESLSFSLPTIRGRLVWEVLRDCCALSVLYVWHQRFRNFVQLPSSSYFVSIVGRTASTGKRLQCTLKNDLGMIYDRAYLVHDPRECSVAAHARK